ncbi:MAG: hypothetical protein GY953_28145 [bacterium]|nr:hypothetical protein [bacterium]
MREISEMVHDGAMAFLRRECEYTIFSVLIVVVFGLSGSPSGRSSRQSRDSGARWSF